MHFTRFAAILSILLDRDGQTGLVGRAHPTQLLALPGEIIVGVQINDAMSVPANDIVYESMHGRLLPGEGAIDLVEAIRTLDAIGSQAPIGVEVFSDELNKLRPIEAARKVGGAARAILATARTRDN